MITMRSTFSCLMGTILVLSISAGAEAGNFPRDPSDLASIECLLIDTDSNLDDLRAIGLVAPHIRVAAIITTDGILPARQGASVVAKFLANFQAEDPIPVIVGTGPSSVPQSTPSWDWLSKTRSQAANIESLLSSSFPSSKVVSSPRQGNIGPLIAEATQNCSGIGLLMIGPWSSFPRYIDGIAGRLKFIVVQGRSLFDPGPPDDPNWDRVNCKMDRDACAFASGRLYAYPIYWIDLPKEGPPISVTRKMVDGLNSTPHLALVLKEIMTRDLS